MIEDFDYIGFSESMLEQAKESLPQDIPEIYRKKILNAISNFTSIAGENLVKDNSGNYTVEQTVFICQTIAEWTFHKGVDLCKSQISSKYWDKILQKIAFTIYEIANQGFEKGIEEEDILNEIVLQVQKVYKDCIEELHNNGDIDSKITKVAESQSNFDKMKNEISQKNTKTKILGALKMGLEFCFIQYWIFFGMRIIHKIHRHISSFDTLLTMLALTFIAGIITYFVINKNGDE